MSWITKSTLVGIIICSTFACNNKRQDQVKLDTPEACRQQIGDVMAQLDGLRSIAMENNKIPRTVTKEGEMHWTKEGFDWTEGFFPGSMWLLYMETQDEKWKVAAEKLQKNYVDHRHLTYSHDLGFVFNCSYGNAIKATNSETYKQYLIDASNSLITRFNDHVGCIQSWNVDKGWQATRGWEYPVIIDNMMNLEMLFKTSILTGDQIYYDLAVTHANTTLKNHFRKDQSSYHVVDYDPETGNVRAKHTAQGYSHESAWARGQAWGLYGFTVCYRYTKDEKYLKQAENIAQFVLNHENLPADMVPYWDFNAPKIPNEPRDASAATIIASALLELNEYSTNDYLKPACDMLESLSGKAYKARLNKNHNFYLMHSVGSIPHGAEINVPLNYADYYYIEALTRLEDGLSDKKLARN